MRARSNSVSANGSGKRGQKMPLLALICLIALLSPINFHLGTLLLTPSRALLLVVLPILFAQFLMGKYGRPTVIDWLFIFYVFWFTLSVAVNNPGAAVTFAGSNSVILLGGFMVGRTTIRNLDDFLGFVRVFSIIILAALPLALYETLTSDVLIPRLIEAAGFGSVRDVNYSPRLGFSRVQLVFAHPIHYGFFCSLSVGLFFVAMRGQVSRFRRWLQTGAQGLMTFLSLSSGPFLAMLIQMILIFWLHIMKSYRRPWIILVWLMSALYVLLEIASNGPALYYIISKLAFNPATVNVRRILLDYGIDQIKVTPIFGINNRPWNLPPWMTGSLDNYWLGLALAYGVPAFLGLFLAFVIAIVKIARRDFPPESALDRARIAWVTSMVGATLTLGTVYIWNEIASFMFFFFGAGLWMLNAPVEQQQTDEAVVNKRTPISFSRFASDKVRARPDGGAKSRRMESLGRGRR